jgi:hypothetical protein
MLAHLRLRLNLPTDVAMGRWFCRGFAFREQVWNAGGLEKKPLVGGLVWDNV